MEFERRSRRRGRRGSPAPAMAHGSSSRRRPCATGQQAKTAVDMQGGAIACGPRAGMNSLFPPLDRLRFRVSPHDWRRIVEDFRVSAFGQHSCATVTFILGCLFHVSDLDISPQGNEEGEGEETTAAAEREGVIAALALAEIQRRIDVLQDGGGSREMASDLVASVERTLRQGGIIYHHADEVLRILTKEKVEDILQEDPACLASELSDADMVNRATKVCSQASWDESSWENVSSTLRSRGYLPGERNRNNKYMDLSLDFRVAGIALTKKIHFGIQKLSNPDERPRRFFREVMVQYSGKVPLLLRTVRLLVHSLPLSPMFMKVHDDLGFAKENGVHAGFFPSTSQNRLAFKTGDSFTFTIEIQNNLPESGLLHHDLVFIFSLNDKTNSQAFIVCHTEIFAFFVKKSDFDAVKLDFNAASFYPSSLRNIFAQQAQEICTDPMDPAAMITPRGSWHLPQTVMKDDINCDMYPEIYRQEISKLNSELLPGILNSIERWSCKFSCEGGSILRRELRLLMMEYHALLSLVPAYDIFNHEIRLHQKAHSMYVDESATYVTNATVLTTSIKYEQKRAEIVVPGAPDGRPHISYGGVVLLRTRQSPVIEIKCRVISVRGTVVTLRLPTSSPSFKSDAAEVIESNSYIMHCRFIPDCVKLARSLNGLTRALNFSATGAESCCFQFAITPCHEHQHESGAVRDYRSNKARDMRDIKWNDKKLNIEQKTAVHWYCNHTTAIDSSKIGFHKPILVFGPPGTGKSSTVVECVLQIMKTQPLCRICLSAPSEFAVDLLVSALASFGLGENEMHRLCDPRRIVASVKPDVQRFCYVNNKTYTHDIPPEGLEKYRIIAVSCGTSSLLETWIDSQQGSRRLHFTHVLIDEAAQATFSESLNAIMFPYVHQDLVCLPRLLLVGDPLQLGPALNSTIGQRMLLGKSLLEGLINEHINNYDAENGLSIGNFSISVMLRRNYRSHRQLLSLPSSIFYQNRLIPSADDSLTKVPTEWSELKGFQFPILFYKVSGQQIKKGETDSYYNTLEALKVVSLVENMIDEGAASVEDLGVMATYRSQVVKIRQLFRDRGLRDVRVGTVEDYQGQEAQIIFISTVVSDVKALRSARNSEAPDLILGSPSRFNVAITRARALLVVVGHPRVLSEDKYWQEVLALCQARGTLRGGHSGVESVTDPEEERVTDMLGARVNLGYGNRDQVYNGLRDQEFEGEMARIEIN